jgi:DNA-binding transcriptional regulator YdaS (Cro superfamily)
MSDLKELTAHAIERTGSRHDVSKMLGVSETELSYWCNPDNTRYIPIDHWVDLDRASGNFFLKELARESGFDLIARKVNPAPVASVFHIIAEFSRAAGHFAFTVLEAAMDGVFTPNERRKIQQAARPLKDCLDNVDHVTAK